MADESQTRAPAASTGWDLATPLVAGLLLCAATYYLLSSDVVTRWAAKDQFTRRYQESWIIRLQIAIFAFGIFYGLWQLAIWLGRDVRITLVQAGSLGRFDSRVRSRLSALSFAAWSLPVWGFIGTVSGVTDAIQALRDMAGTGSAAAAGAKAGSVSDAMPGVLKGLYEAFDTTMVGLVLVIPLTILMHVLTSGYDETLARLKE